MLRYKNRRKGLGSLAPQGATGDFLFDHFIDASKMAVDNFHWQIQRWIAQIGQEAEIGRKVTPHQYRHGKAHRMIDKGATLVDVQNALGHVNPASTFNYLRFTVRENEQRARKFF